MEMHAYGARTDATDSACLDASHQSRAPLLTHIRSHARAVRMHFHRVCTRAQETHEIVAIKKFKESQDDEMVRKVRKRSNHRTEESLAASDGRGDCREEKRGSGNDDAHADAHVILPLDVCLACALVCA
jgi:hypothetical protein